MCPFFMGVCLDASAQTKKTIEYKAPNFGCTFEDGPFKAMIKVEQKGQPKINLEFSTSVEIQGCQVIHIDFDKIYKEPDVLPHAQGNSNSPPPHTEFVQ